MKTLTSESMSPRTARISTLSVVGNNIIMLIFLPKLSQPKVHYFIFWSKVIKETMIFSQKYFKRFKPCKLVSLCLSLCFNVFKDMRLHFRKSNGIKKETESLCYSVAVILGPESVFQSHMPKNRSMFS